MERCDANAANSGLTAPNGMTTNACASDQFATGTGVLTLPFRGQPFYLLFLYQVPSRGISVLCAVQMQAGRILRLHCHKKWRVNFLIEIV